jgi:glutamate dehydrogenase/leucine dehydrogenase
VSYFEWLQDQQRHPWDASELTGRLHAHLQRAFDRVDAAADRLDCDWRTAALTVAVAHVAKAANARGIYP